MQIWCFASVAFVGISGIALAQCGGGQQEHVFVGPVDPEYLSFGRLVEVDGDFVVVGGEGYTTGFHPTKAFERQSNGAWLDSGILTGSDTVPADSFGWAMDMSGGRIAIGAPVKTDAFGVIQGAVYIFDRVAPGSWSQVAKITPDPSPSPHYFGDELAIDGSTVFVAYRDTANHRSVLVYEQNGAVWKKVATLTGQNSPGSGYNEAIDIKGNVAVVLESDFNPSEAYIYERVSGVWAQAAKIPCEPSFDVKTDGTTVVAGESGASLKVIRKVAGAWSLVGQINPPTGSSGNFTAGFDVSGNTIVATDNSTKLAYVFQGTGANWTQQGTITSSDPAASPFYAVAMSPNSLLIGAPLSHGTGAAYLFPLNAEMSGFFQYGNGCPGSGGIVPVLAGSGCANAGSIVQLDITNGVGKSYAMVFLGAQQVAVPLGFGCSLLAGPLFPLVLGPLFLQPIGASGPGIGHVSIAGQIPSPVPAFSITMQCLIPDLGVSAGFSATNGLRLTVN